MPRSIHGSKERVEKRKCSETCLIPNWHSVDQKLPSMEAYFQSWLSFYHSEMWYTYPASCTVTVLQYYSASFSVLIKGSEMLCAYHSIIMVPFLSSLPRSTKPTMFSALSEISSQNQPPPAECCLSWPWKKVCIICGLMKPDAGCVLGAQQVLQNLCAVPGRQPRQKIYCSSGTGCIWRNSLKLGDLSDFNSVHWQDFLIWVLMLQ